MPKTKQRETFSQVDVIPGECPRCLCTEREPYFAIARHDKSGIGPSGRPYTRITKKRTRCKRCGHPRVDRFFENVPIKDGDASE